ncbi:hypothetical protein [Streptomyces sp. NPDC000410]|uniref:hypothetical protein n=1 Tax=Streptomyces sp. NPDC000410 TaxID=3154254 RepID=UPI003333EF28
MAFLAALALVVFFLLRCLGAALPGDGHRSGWRRVLLVVAYACAATATASYSWGALTLMSTVAVAQDGGADSAPFPYNHPCRSQLKGAVDYDVEFLTLRTVCVLEGGERRAVDDVPQRVRVTAAASAVSTAVLAGILLAAEAPRERRRSVSGSR